MDRRNLNRSDDSTTSHFSVSESLRKLVLNTFGESAGIYIFGDVEQQIAHPETILQRMLSTRTAISTTSTLAEVNQRARDDATLQKFSQIGRGQCGTVFALQGTTSAIKLPNAANKQDELYRDFVMHRRIFNAFPAASHIRDNIHIPRAITWIGPTTAEFWNTKKDLFPAGVVVPNYGLLSERIFPVPFPVREAIVAALCPKAVQEAKNQFLGEAENKDCLVRLYLGRRNDTRKLEPRNIRLRNFPLHMDEIERLGLNVDFYAKVMAQALAVMHWRAGVDANDVEFVLGSSPEVLRDPTDEELASTDKDTALDLCKVDFEHRTLSIWLLDFNQCKMFTHDNEGIKMLVNGFWCNDPYYPRPNASNSNDKRLWKVFERQYLDVSAELVQDNSGPRLFIEGVVEAGKARPKEGSMFG